jgi:radical SAM superfamily enzyme YgiQ (UPF0313 family)
VLIEFELVREPPNNVTHIPTLLFHGDCFEEQTEMVYCRFMRVLLISANTERVNMPTIPLGLMIVAEASKLSGHDVEFLDLMHNEDPTIALHNRIGSFNPEVIGISVRNIDDQSLENPRFLLENIRPLIELCRLASSAPIVLGGAGYSIFPDAVLEYLGADMGVDGEGEMTFPALLERITQGKDPATLPGVHIRGRKGRLEKKFCTALDTLPLPQDAAWANADPKSADTWIPIESRRGCPNFCSYCSTFKIQGRTVRTRSPRLIARHMERLAGLGFRQYYVVDNSFNIPESQGLEFCNSLIDLQLGIKWKAILYPHGVTERLVTSMKRAGCFEVALGFESGSERILKELNKHFVPDEVRCTSKMLADNGIQCIGFLLLGGPGETRKTVEESLEFADSLDLDGLRTTVGIRIYPGTQLAKRALAEGMITPENDLLLPHFYIAPDVDPWIRNAVTVGFTLKK